MLHPYLHKGGYSIIHTTPEPCNTHTEDYIDYSSLPVASASLQQKLDAIKEENNVSKNLALMKRNKAFLQDLPEVSNPEFTMDVGSWLNYAHNPNLEVTVVGRQGHFVALQTKFN